MSREFIGSAQGRSFKRSINRDRRSRGGVPPPLFFIYTAGSRIGAGAKWWRQTQNYPQPSLKGRIRRSSLPIAAGYFKAQWLAQGAPGIPHRAAGLHRYTIRIRGVSEMIRNEIHLEQGREEENLFGPAIGISVPGMVPGVARKVRLNVTVTDPASVANINHDGGIASIGSVLSVDSDDLTVIVNAAENAVPGVVVPYEREFTMSVNATLPGQQCSMGLVVYLHWSRYGFIAYPSNGVQTGFPIAVTIRDGGYGGLEQDFDLLDSSTQPDLSTIGTLIDQMTAFPAAIFKQNSSELIHRSIVENVPLNGPDATLPGGGSIPSLRDAGVSHIVQMAIMSAEPISAYEAPTMRVLSGPA